MLAIPINFLIVLGSIILFMAPFYLWYRLAYRRDHTEPLPFNHHLEQFFSGRQANALVFFWALGEAVVWFVIPEFLLLMMVFMRVKNKTQLVLYDIYGTAAGVLVAFALDLPRAAVERLPYIQPKMVQQVTEWYDSLGVWGLIHQPFSGVPFKVFTHAADEYHFHFFIFLSVAVLVRMSRYIIAYGVFVAIYPILHRHVRRNYIPLFVIATFIFSILLWRVYRSYA